MFDSPHSAFKLLNENLFIYPMCFLQGLIDTTPSEKIRFRMKSTLISDQGFAIWQKYEKFCLEDHVFEGQKHRRGITTERKIQV